jgi:Helix-turn-helix
MQRPVIVRDSAHAVSVLYQARLDQDIPVTELAEWLGCGHPQVIRWLRGQRDPLMSNFLKLVHALGYDLALIPREPR